MRASLLVLAVCAALLLQPRAPVFAHHSFEAEFDDKDPVTLKGTITRLEWANPHCWIHLDVAGPGGKIVNWAVETAAPTVLLSRGLTKDDFRVGSKVVVDGYRAKKKAATAAGRIIRLMDGTELFLR